MENHSNMPSTGDLLGEWLDTESGLVAEIARDELDEIAQLSEKINALEKLIVDRVRSGGCSLVEIPGCAEITAAKIIGETANITRFKNEAAFARYIGVAPLPQWSGCSAGRMRMTRSGNRQINVALHRIALSQIRMDGPGRAYYRKRIAAGDPPAQCFAQAEAPREPGGIHPSARRSQQASLFGSRASRVTAGRRRGDWSYRPRNRGSDERRSPSSHPRMRQSATLAHPRTHLLGICCISVAHSATAASRRRRNM